MDPSHAPLSPSDCAAIVLVGGRSTRFGQDKSRFRWRGSRLVDHILAHLPADRAGTLLVMRADQDEGAWPEVAITHDQEDLPDGPVRGVYSGLETLQIPWAWVLAVDQPGINPGVLEEMCRQAEAGDVALAWQHEGRMQPMPCLIRVDAAANLRTYLATGKQSLIGALEFLEARWLDTTEFPDLEKPSLLFANLNRPEDVGRLEMLLNLQPPNGEA